MNGGRVVTALAVMCLFAASLHAQTVSALPGRVEVGGGVRWTGAAKFGTADANQTLPDGGTTPLFETETRLEPVIAYEARFGFGVSRSIQIDVGASWGHAD